LERLQQAFDEYSLSSEEIAFKVIQQEEENF
jgi:hypothetical protein